MHKQDFIEYIASYLIETSYETVTCLPQRTMASNPSPSRLVGRHFPKRILVIKMAISVEHATSQRISL